MRVLLELSGEHRSLPEAEALACLEALGQPYKALSREERILVVETDVPWRELAKRIALSHFIDEEIACGSLEEVFKEAGGLDVGGRSFRVRFKALGGKAKPQYLERELGALIGRKGKVDLERPDVEFLLLLSKNYHLAMRKAEIDRSSFEARKVGKRPFFYPISLHPRLARALVNLSRVRRGEHLLDPFCGTGGILIEAGMIGAKLIGSDIKEEMISGCKENLRVFDLSSALYQCDVSEIPSKVNKVEAIATDPPYGRSASTLRERIEELYDRAFETFTNLLKKKRYLAIVLPKKEFVEMGKDFFELQEIHPFKVHASLTRYFCVYRN